jgi:MoxR-like ATPase
MNESEKIFVKPKWARELFRFLPTKSQFVLWGNVYDVYPFESGGKRTTLNMCSYLHQSFKQEGYEFIIQYEPLIGFSLLDGDAEQLEKICGLRLNPGGTSHPVPLLEAIDFIQRVVEYNCHKENIRANAAIILNFSSRIDASRIDVTQEAKNFFYFAHRLSMTAFPKLFDSEGSEDAANPPKIPLSRHSPLLWIVEREADLPEWFLIDNQKIRILPVPKPDNDIRRFIIESLAPNIPCYGEMDDDDRADSIQLFITQTNGLFAGEIISICKTARRENIPFSEIGEAIRGYKLGIPENLWAKLDRKRILNAESILSKSVMGQGRAIRHTADILKRAVFNLSGAQFSKISQRPKGVLFLAGPTGVGKTELAKSISELVFGSPNNYIRFDMSEFSQTHADQRLIGAPPGYVGYDKGGELTSAIKQNPFSVVLFDEIEKANSKILDMFLQILDDGRLTSGRGETVYFSESLIIFTSNLGMNEVLDDGTKRQIVTSDMKYEEMVEKVKDAIYDYFKYKINRPEILNRIGKNIIIFDFVRNETASLIFEKMLSNVLHRLKDSHDISLEISDEVKKELLIHVSRDLSMGGRGIGNNIEEILVNPLSRELFNVEVKPGDILSLKRICEDNGWSVEVEKQIMKACSNEGN